METLERVTFSISLGTDAIRQINTDKRSLFFQLRIRGGQQSAHPTG